MADAAEAGDDDARLAVFRQHGVSTAAAAARWRSERVSEAPIFARKGMAIMVSVTTSMMLRLVGSSIRPVGQRCGGDDEAELAAGPEQHGGFECRPAVDAEQPRQHVDDDALDENEARRKAERIDGGGEQRVEIELQPDDEEEGAEQQALEGLDHRLDGAAVFGFGQHQPGDEGAERHRDAGEVRGGGRCRRRSAGWRP